MQNVNNVQINKHITQCIDSQMLQNVGYQPSECCLPGEVGNYTSHMSGKYYFFILQLMTRRKYRKAISKLEPSNLETVHFCLSGYRHMEHLTTSLLRDSEHNSKQRHHH